MAVVPFRDPASTRRDDVLPTDVARVLDRIVRKATDVARRHPIALVFIEAFLDQFLT